MSEAKPAQASKRPRVVREKVSTARRLLDILVPGKGLFDTEVHEGVSHHARVRNVIPTKVGIQRTAHAHDFLKPEAYGDFLHHIHHIHSVHHVHNS